MKNILRKLALIRRDLEPVLDREVLEYWSCCDLTGWDVDDLLTCIEEVVKEYLEEKEKMNLT